MSNNSNNQINKFITIENALEGVYRTGKSPFSVNILTKEPKKVYEKIMKKLKVEYVEYSILSSIFTLAFFIRNTEKNDDILERVLRINQITGEVYSNTVRNNRINDCVSEHIDSLREVVNKTLNYDKKMSKKDILIYLKKVIKPEYIRLLGKFTQNTQNSMASKEKKSYFSSFFSHNGDSYIKTTDKDELIKFLLESLENLYRIICELNGNSNTYIVKYYI